MRTTVDLPDELFRRVKAQAATRGETITEFLERAVPELGTAGPQRSGRVALPLVGGAHPGAVDISNPDIEAVFAEEDAEKAQSH